MLSFRLLSVFFSYSPASYAPHRVIRTHAFSGKTTLNFIHLVTISCLFGRAVASVLCLHFVMLNIIEEQMQLKCDREGLTLSLSLFAARTEKRRENRRSMTLWMKYWGVQQAGSIEIRPKMFFVSNEISLFFFWC